MRKHKVVGSLDVINEKRVFPRILISIVVTSERLGQTNLPSIILVSRQLLIFNCVKKYKGFLDRYVCNLSRNSRYSGKMIFYIFNF